MRTATKIFRHRGFDIGNVLILLGNGNGFFRDWRIQYFNVEVT